MRFLVLSSHHDYRTPRRASIHFIADELAKRGSVRFLSMRYSALTRRKGDIRSFLDARSNRVEVHNGVECYLWKTPIHPFGLRRAWLRPVEDALFWLYTHFPDRTLTDWLKQADVIVYESGIAPMFFTLAKELNPKARHIYRASDDLQTINVADHVYREFSRLSGGFDAVCLVSRSMAPAIPDKSNLWCVPHGLEDNLETLGDPSPYGLGRHAVAVGSMLFDPGFIAIASHAYPELTFHVIGSGQPRSPDYADNVVVYDHMPFAETIRYIKHADIGLAPYISEDVPVYLADSSMKMLQYDYFALPTVCPNSVTGGYRSRFGYVPGDAETIRLAVHSALAAPRERSRQILNWPNAVDRLLNPARFADTAV